MPSAFIIPKICLSADSNQEFSDLLLNHGQVDDAQVAMFTFSTLSASIWYHIWGSCAIFAFPQWATSRFGNFLYYL